MSIKVCIPIAAKTLETCLEKIEQASEMADVVEIWLGELPADQLDWEKLFSVKKTPYILTVKDEKEHGGFQGSNEEKLEILLEGALRGAEYCDLDFEFPEKFMKKFVSEKKETELILSAHFFDGTPSLPSLLNRVQKMRNRGADIVKVATMATTDKDLITILRLAENLKRQNQRFIAISIGELGKPSRILTPLLGGEMMFATLDSTSETAPGQMSAEEMRAVWKHFL